MRKTIAMLALVCAAAPAMAQIALPPLGGTLDRVGGMMDPVLGPVGNLAQDAAQLARDRLDRLTRLVRDESRTIEFDEDRQPARRGEAILLDPDPASLQAARSAGFALLEQGQIDGLGIAYAQLAIPPGEQLASGIRRLRKVLPGKTVSADQLHFQSGTSARGSGHGGAAASGTQLRGGTVGIIDGGVPPGKRIAGQRGFATGAPRPSNHASEIASLLAGAGVQRIWCADVYGTDPAGGDALAIARALGWMTGERVPVVSISLVGPPNPLLERAVAAARARGTTVVAAVGNDGAAAPPAYPASYPGVLAVTGVDRRGRVLIEAGRALHLDYAAPGADITALGANGRRTSLRGTSFAAPLAAARAAAQRQAGKTGGALISALNAEAVHGGGRYGRGVLCGDCRKGI